MPDNRDFVQLLSHLKTHRAFNDRAFMVLVEDTSQEVALRMMARFEKTLEDAISTLKQGLEQQDANRIWRICHKVASGSGLLGFQSLSDHSRELSEGIKASVDIEEHLSELKNYLADCETIKTDLSSSCPYLQRYLE